MLTVSTKLVAQHTIIGCPFYISCCPGPTIELVDIPLTKLFWMSQGTSVENTCQQLASVDKHVDQTNNRVDIHAAEHIESLARN